MNKLVVASAAAVLFTFGTFASGDTIISDSFESGDISKTSAHGFKWGNQEVNHVVSADAEASATSSGLTALESSRWEAKTGDYALLFRYDAGQSWNERRFRFSQPQTEIWMSFWLRVPTNYTHPEKGGSGDNQKLFYLWMDGYSTKGEGSSVGMEFRGDGNGGSYFYIKNTKGNYTGSGGDSGKAQFITVPRDRGRWMHLVTHIKSESALGASDGTIGVWRKWEDETDYIQTQNLTNRPIRVASAVPGFANGYLMGWANAAYPVDTEFLIDDFVLSTVPLISSPLAPTPPTGLAVE
jgi:hypothetical protein